MDKKVKGEGFKALFLSYLKALPTMLFNKLKGEGTKLILKKFFGIQAMGGFKMWIIMFVAEHLYEELDERVVEPLVRKIGKMIEIEKGKKVFKEVKDAEDVDDWADAHRNV